MGAGVLAGVADLHIETRGGVELEESSLIQPTVPFSQRRVQEFARRRVTQSAADAPTNSGIAQAHGCQNGFAMTSASGSVCSGVHGLVVHGLVVRRLL